MTRSTGSSETPGELTGGRMVSSVSAEEPTTSTSRATVLGLLQRTPGLTRRSIRPLQLSRTIQTTTQPSIHSHSQLTTKPQERTKSHPTISSEPRPEAAVLSRPSSQMVKSTPSHAPGSSSREKTCQSLSTGETWMVSTISHGTRTSTSHSTADHAGLRAPPLPLPTDSTSSTREQTRKLLQLVLTLRLLSTAKLVVPATEETQEVSTRSPTRQVSLTPLANSTLLTTFRDACARTSILAVTAPGHPTQKVMSPSTTARPSTTSGTTSVTTTLSAVLTR